jgi:hypothetical protein
MVRLTDQAGLREYFNPTTGTGHGTDDFSWSAALLINSLTGGPDNEGEGTNR